MPAIQPGRLKFQAAQLVEHFTDPPAFCRALDGLLDYYADRTYRPGLTGAPRPLLPAYHVADQVLRLIFRELAPSARADRQAALNLCHALWAVAIFEFRWLAAVLIGQVTPQPPAEILELVGQWAVPSTEERLVDALVFSGLERLRQEQPNRYLSQIEAWLDTGNTFQQHLGLKALLPLLEMGEYSNLPALFQLITPLVRSAPSSLRPDLVEILHRLAVLTPKETAYFLRQNLSIQQDNPGTPWLTRNTIEYFPQEVQANLRASLREASRERRS